MKRIAISLAIFAAATFPHVAIAQSAGGGTPVTSTSTSVSNMPTASSGAVTAFTTSTTSGTSSSLSAVNNSRTVLFVENEAAAGGGTIAVCPASVATPGINAAGCKTLYPGQNWAPCSAAYCPADAFNVVGSAPSVPVLLQQK